MKKYTIELSDDLAAVYEDIAKVNKKSTEKSLQIILERIITSLLNKRPEKPKRNSFWFE